MLYSGNTTHILDLQYTYMNWLQWAILLCIYSKYNLKLVAEVNAIQGSSYAGQRWMGLASCKLADHHSH